MTNNSLKISIITIVYNRSETVSQALESIFSQRYSNFETIVVDGGSTDGTLLVIDKYIKNINIFIAEKDDGIYDALNKGVALATGDVIGILHADDLLENNDILYKISNVFADPSIEAVYGDLVYVKSNNINQVIRYWKAGIYDQSSFKRGWMPPHPTLYLRRSVYERFGLFDIRYRISADYDAILRFLAIEKVRTAYIPEILVRMRAGGISNRSLANIINKSLEDFDIIRRYNMGGVLTLLLKNIRKFRQFLYR